LNRLGENQKREINKYYGVQRFQTQMMMMMMMMTKVSNTNDDLNKKLLLYIILSHCLDANHRYNARRP